MSAVRIDPTTRAISPLPAEQVAVAAAAAWPVFDAAGVTPDAAAQAFLAGQNDAAVTYEPFISAVRDKPDQGHIIATTLDYPMVLDTVGCTPDFLKANPDAAKALADSYFEALDAIKADPQKSYETMGADVKQSAKEFEDSAKYLKWADKAENKQFFTKDFADFSNTAADLLLSMGLIKEKPDVSTLVDTSAVAD